MVTSARNIAILTFCLCGLAQAHADESQREGGAVFRFGAFLGGSLVDWAGADVDGEVPGEVTVAKPGFHTGLVMTVALDTLLSLDFEPVRLLAQPELAYAAKGTGYERDGVEGTYSVDLRYLQAGFLLRGEYSPAGSLAPYVVLGPELGFLRSAEFNNRFGMTADIRDNLKSTDLGLVLGLGAMYALPPWGSLGLELRADLGLVSIDGQGDGDEIRNAALTLLLAYLY
jgi:hypothetical protein